MIEARQLHVFLHGEEKTGKSTLISQIEGATLIDCEGGMRLLPVEPIKVSCWKDFRIAIRALKPGTKTVCIDALDTLYALYRREFLDSNNITHESDMKYGKAWDMQRFTFTSTIQALMSEGNKKGFGVWLVSNSCTAYESDRLVPNLPDKVSLSITKAVDLILHLSTDRRIKTKPSSRWLAGDRTGKLPESIKINWKELEGAINEAIKGSDD